MAFDSFKSIGEVAAEYQIKLFETPFIQPINLEINPFFREQLAFHLSEFNFRESESAVCEMVIFPILAEVYKNHRHKFVLWSHKTRCLHPRPQSLSAQRSGRPDVSLKLSIPKL